MGKIRTFFDSSDDATAACGNAAKITQKQATRIFIGQLEIVKQAALELTLTALCMSQGYNEPDGAKSVMVDRCFASSRPEIFGQWGTK
jgi:hypothetical protein